MYLNISGADLKVTGIISSQIALAENPTYPLLPCPANQWRGKVCANNVFYTDLVWSLPLLSMSLNTVNAP